MQDWVTAAMLLTPGGKKGNRNHHNSHITTPDAPHGKPKGDADGSGKPKEGDADSKKQDGDDGNATKPKSNAPESNNNKGKGGEAYEGGGSGARKATPEEAAKITQIRKDFKISKNKNIAHVEGKIDGKLIDLKSYSGKDKRPGTVDPIPQEKQQLKTQPTSGDKAKGQIDLDRRAYDSEVKALEKILSETTPESSGKIKLLSERDLCGSCSDAVKQFKILRPNIEIETVYSTPYSNPL